VQSNIGDAGDSPIIGLQATSIAIPEIGVKIRGSLGLIPECRACERHSAAQGEGLRLPPFGATTAKYHQVEKQRGPSGTSWTKMQHRLGGKSRSAYCV
jgi:hypothetical protein